MVWLLAVCVVAGTLDAAAILLAVVGAQLVRAWVLGRRSALAWVTVSLLCYAVGAFAGARSDADRNLVAAEAAGRGAAVIELSGRVVSFPQTSPHGTRFDLETCLDGRRVRLSTRVAAFDVNYGDGVRVRGRLRPLSQGAGTLVAHGVDGELRVRALAWERTAPGRPGVRGVLWRAHRALRIRLCRGLGGDAALPLALLLGERGHLGAELFAAVRRLGIVHLLAISGLHLSIIAGFALAVARLVPAWTNALVFAGVTLYVGVVGGVDSLTRAYTMLVLLAGARSLLRPVRALDALGKALLVILLASPLALHSIGLQLSFAATLAVLLTVRIWRPAGASGRSRLARSAAMGIRAVATAFVLSITVEAFILPIQLHHFGVVSLVGPLATCLFLVPIMVVELLAILAIACWGIPALGAAMTWALEAASRATCGAMLVAGRIAPEPSSFAGPDPFLFYAGLATLWAGRRRVAAWTAGIALIAGSLARSGPG